MTESEIHFDHFDLDHLDHLDHPPPHFDHAIAAPMNTG